MLDDIFDGPLSDPCLMCSCHSGWGGCCAPLTPPPFPTAATIAGEAAASRAEELLMEDGPPELDEFGRNVNMQREREGRERR